MESTKTAGLYIHVPFCKGKCPYCKFYSRKFPEYDETTARSFKQAVIRDVRDWSQRENLTFDTVFFGGGTPSLLFREAADIIAAAGRTYDCEITLEANPDDVTPQMLSTLRDGGVNRLSVGVQSLNDRTLAALGRRHSAKQAITAIEAADRAGFANISADIMLGVPGQTDSELRETIAALKSLPLTHYSAYLFESDSAAPEDLMAELYLTAVELLPAQYEISNWGKPCRHNLKYWNCEDYIGIGATAHSCYGGKRFAQNESGACYATDENPCSRDERVMLGLRLCVGIEADDALLERAQGIPREYLRINGRNLSLTAKGFLISNTIITTLLA